ncbi:hypothetical protein AB6D72_09820 [Vibrio alginolyticus]|uniref:hypothetical protein n=1 Tax=Vibrio TaxID=662 RepID=UPI002964C19E|nr:hypothetical protein [Vibrio sp. 2092]MCA2475451.1 hypothetical protein [Vibrio alginolyticus]MDW2155480.1 hypothetical protein [Vibrio sp. 2092]MDW2231638.1 hypothetical protein [Vibrio sp. 2091]
MTSRGFSVLVESKIKIGLLVSWAVIALALIYPSAMMYLVDVTNLNKHLLVSLPGVAAVFVNLCTVRLRGLIVSSASFEIELKNESAYDLRNKYIRSITRTNSIQYLLAVFTVFLGAYVLAS